jgi:hypothetical protein
MIENGNKVDEKLKKPGILRKFLTWIAQGAEKQGSGKIDCLTCQVRPLQPPGRKRPKQ